MYDKVAVKNNCYNKLLKGVIFGIKTPEYHKRKVYDALLKKKDIFKEISFYQAVFDEEEQSIKIREKIGWKL
ncbi:MAG: hypothetical protein IKZ43_08375 [Acidaminococcaceae bacterium]|nr:hypothetical protein [Acidaminococcaceae bacterium]